MVRILTWLILSVGLMLSPKANSRPWANPVIRWPKKAELVAYVRGDTADIQTTTQSGYCLMGGGEYVREAFAWLVDRSGGGDVVVLRATEADHYNAYFFDTIGGVHSVETLVIDRRHKANRPDVYRKIINAELLFIAGGDQWDYVRCWRNTLVEKAIRQLIHDKRVPIGGSSAGCAIMGQVYFAARRGTVTSEQALKNPYHRKVTLSKDDMMGIPFLRETITDTHYSQRARAGRHMVFLARMITDWHMYAKGIGCDEHAALCIDEQGWGTVLGSGTVFFLSQTRDGPERCDRRKPLEWNRNMQAVLVYAVSGMQSTNRYFDLKQWTPTPGTSTSFYFIRQGRLESQPIPSH